LHADVELTSQEKAILRLLAEKRKNAEIAGVLFIIEGTVKRHLWNIYRKLGVKNRRAAVSRARALSLIE
jgi:LuxR family transcriptional regulator of csgAB operon